MPLPLTKSQIERLGTRLAQTREPTDEDLYFLNVLLLAYDETLAKAMEKVRFLGFDPTGRIKNMGTILEKLTRHGGSWLKSMQDLAGMRIVLHGGRKEQDQATAKIVEAFGAADRAPRIVDRRLTPSQGYRAIHVIVYPAGIPVEIQVRTRWQHEWADMFEKLADLIGRGIRYGEPPTHWRAVVDAQMADMSPEQADLANDLYEKSYLVRIVTVDTAITLSDLISALEEAEAAGFNPDNPDIGKMWTMVNEGIASLREQMRQMTPDLSDKRSC